MNTQVPLLNYFGVPKQTESLKLALKKDKVKIQIQGLIGSAFSITASAVVRKSSKPHLFILRDKEEASYLINDIENLLKNEVFFFPASHHRAYKIEKTNNNTNALMRVEVLKESFIF